MNIQITQAFDTIQSEVMHEAVIYRPTLGKLTQSVTSAMLLERIRYYAMKKGGDFYKFNDACDNPKYRDGDSWQEELGFTRYEFEGARKKIATRVAKGDSKSDLMEVFNADGDLAPATQIVLYWRDKDNTMWYRFNEDLYIAHLIKTVDASIPNVEIQHYLEMRKSNITYLPRENHITFTTEKHKETDKETTPLPPSQEAEESNEPMVVDEVGGDDGFKEVFDKLQSLAIVVTPTTLELFKSDYNDYSKHLWLEAIEAFLVERAKPESRIKKPYSYIMGILRRTSEKQQVKNEIAEQAKKRTDDAHDKVMQDYLASQKRIEQLKQERHNEQLGETA